MVVLYLKNLAKKGVQVLPSINIATYITNKIEFEGLFGNICLRSYYNLLYRDSSINS